MSETNFDDARAMIEALTPSYPVYCMRAGVLAETAREFLERFPGRVLYAVKCNPHPIVLQALYDAGIRHFDTASLPEIAQVREMFSDTTAYFMHPVKARAVIKTSHDVYGVRHFVIDHPSELTKVMDETGGEGVAIIVRMATPHAGAAFDLSTKFGASPALATDLLRAVRDEGCQGGLAFHVGSQCLSPRAYRTALGLVGEVAEAAGTEDREKEVKMSPLCREQGDVQEGECQSVRSGEEMVAGFFFRASTSRNCRNRKSRIG